MQHIKYRCKHCRKTYLYCTYGNGPQYGTESGCSEEYCGECQTAITEALSKIPIKFQPKYKEIMPSLGLDKLLQSIKEKNEKPENNSLILYVYGGNYDNIETYTHLGKTFRIEWNNDKPDEKHYFVEMEWDVEKKGYTNKHWEAETNEDTYKYVRAFTTDKITKSLDAAFKRKNVNNPPMGVLFYNEFVWDFSQINHNDKPIKHELTTWNATYTGEEIKILLEHGRMHEKVILADGLSSDDLIDVLTYKTEHQRYTDENIETITKIEIE